MNSKEKTTKLCYTGNQVSLSINLTFFRLFQTVKQRMSVHKGEYLLLKSMSFLIVYKPKRDNVVYEKKTG